MNNSVVEVVVAVLLIAFMWVLTIGAFIVVLGALDGAFNP
jgi:hypothetical protein